MTQRELGRQRQRTMGCRTEERERMGLGFGGVAESWGREGERRRGWAGSSLVRVNLARAATMRRKIGVTGQKREKMGMARGFRSGLLVATRLLKGVTTIDGADGEVASVDGGCRWRRTKEVVVMKSSAQQWGSRVRVAEGGGEFSLRWLRRPSEMVVQRGA
ncbi:uncharacterized protein J3R85_013602 [Psidium guajava]|nr:uncharacterized protein J3R85_013602 [Psidium guajava]